jgi:1,4-dihydroxy-2-naphthoate octaprenyltransferase
MHTAQAWLLATRPKTLLVGMMPVVLGSALAFAHGVFQLAPALAALVCALLMQIASNLINDLYDFRKGADTAERLGPPRAVASGLLSEKAVARAAWAVVLVAFCLGQYLVWVGGWNIFVVGVVSLVVAWAYTGGPYPLAYLGLGEVCAFVFFGIVPVSGTYYVQAQTLRLDVICFAAVPGMFSAAVLLINNIRDIASDRNAGKNTLAVRLGGQASRWLYCTLVLCAACAPLVFWLAGYTAWLVLALTVIPLTLRSMLIVFRSEGVRSEGAALNRVLGLTIIQMALQCTLTALALCIASTVSH